MKTIETKLYEFSELSKEVQKIAMSNYYEKYKPDYSDDIFEFIKELLEENNIGICTIGKKNDFKAYYSLNYCQGDGLCFIGSFYFKNNSNIIYTIKHEGRYYYSESVKLYVLNWNNNQEAYFGFSEGGKFSKIYLEICKQAKKYGYGCYEQTADYIEPEQLFYENGGVYID